MLAIFLLYAKLEENHGLARRALKIYERATEAVLPEARYEVCKCLKIFFAKI
jgi:pre-mRNA-splicing factor SYF1